MQQIIQTYDLKETDTAITKLYKNTKAMARSPDGDVDFFIIATEELLVDT